MNLVVKKDPETGKNRTINLGAKGTMKLGPGDRIIINSPGGGAYGVEDGQVDTMATVPLTVHHERGSVNAYRMRQETN